MTKFKFDQKEYFSKDISQIKFQGQEIGTTDFEECVFNDCDFSEAMFDKCKFIDCQFFKCNLSIVKLNGSRFNNVVFKDCKAIGIDWTKAAWPSIALSSPITFLKCNISDSTFFGLSIRELVIEECKAHDVDFREGDFCKANFTFTDFTNSLFSVSNLTGADFTEAANYRIDINNNKISRAKFSRQEAVSLLDGLDIELID